MSDFDHYINCISSLINEFESEGKNCKILSCDAENSHAFLQIKSEKRAGSGLVMKSETFLELGGPVLGSCNLSLYSINEQLVKDDRIRLIGPDIHECSGESSFGQIVIIAGKKLTDGDYLDLQKYIYTGEQIEGYMMKSTTGNIWSRISKDAAAKGFDFKFLGTALVNIIKSKMPSVASVEIIFVTSSKKDIERLNQIKMKVSEMYQQIKEKKWKQRGIDIYQCAFHGNCNSCKDKPICDEVNRISSVRKKVV